MFHAITARLASRTTYGLPFHRPASGLPIADCRVHERWHGGGVMSLIPDCLYPTPFDQDRQYRKTRTSLISPEGRGPFLLSCLIRTVLRKSYLSPGIDVADRNERISAAEIAGLRMLIRADMHVRPPRRPRRCGVE